MASSEPSEPAGPKLPLAERDHHLEARLVSCRRIREVLAELEALLKIVAEKRPSRLLVDFRALEISLSLLDRYGLGRMGSRFAAHVRRLACVAAPKFIDPQKSGVQVARNRGLKVEIFTDAEEAVRWLTAPGLRGFRRA